MHTLDQSLHVRVKRSSQCVVPTHDSVRALHKPALALANRVEQAHNRRRAAQPDPSRPVRTGLRLYDFALQPQLMPARMPM